MRYKASFIGARGLPSLLVKRFDATNKWDFLEQLAMFCRTSVIPAGVMRIVVYSDENEQKWPIMDIAI